MSEAIASEPPGVTLASAAPAAVPAVARPYRQSWLDSPYDWIGALPGPTWLAREILAKPPIWPWSGATIRGFGSALLQPFLSGML